MSVSSRIQYTVRYFKGEVFVSTNTFTAENDNEAVELAKSAKFAFELELWERDRLVFATDGHTKGRPKPEINP